MDFARSKLTNVLSKNCRYSKINSIINGEKSECEFKMMNCQLKLNRVLNTLQLYGVTSRKVFPTRRVCFEITVGVFNEKT